MYLGIVCFRALQETKKLWTPQKTWVAFASPVVTVPIRGLISGWHMHDVLTTAGLTVLLVAALWGLTFMFDFIRAPALLHRKQQATIATQAKLLEEARPKRTAAEDHRFEYAQAALQALEPECQIVLRHLLEHVTLTINGPRPPPLPDGMDFGRMNWLLHKVEIAHLVSRRIIETTRETVFEIVPSMKAFLEELLYPPEHH